MVFSMANLAALQARVKLVNPDGTPTRYFIRFMDEFVTASVSGTIDGTGRTRSAVYPPKETPRTIAASYPVPTSRRLPAANYKAASPRRVMPANY